jgi:DNA-binding CsgD family transcriptional regulator
LRPHVARLLKGGMPYSEEFVHALVAQAYAGAGNADEWIPFLARLRDSLHGIAAGFHAHDSARGAGAVQVNLGGDPEYVRRYEEHYAALNPWIRREGLAVHAGDVVVGEARRDLVGSAYYEEFWAPQGFFDSLSAYLSEERSVRGALIVVRRKGAPAFDDDDMRLLRVLLPHLRQASALQGRFACQDWTAQALRDALEAMPYGVVLLDDQGAVVFANGAAGVALEAAAGWRLERSALVAPSEVQRRLASLCGRAIDTSLRRGFSAGGTLRVPRSRDGGWLEVRIVPLAGPPRLVASRRVAAAVFLSLEEERRPVDLQALGALFGLTPAEAEVAARVARGQEPGQIGRDLGVSLNTVRTHLKRVFGKTGSRRQGELAGLLQSSVAALSPGQRGEAREPRRRTG